MVVVVVFLYPFIVTDEVEQVNVHHVFGVVALFLDEQLKVILDIGDQLIPILKYHIGQFLIDLARGPTVHFVHQDTPMGHFFSKVMRFGIILMALPVRFGIPYGLKDPAIVQGKACKMLRFHFLLHFTFELPCLGKFFIVFWGHIGDALLKSLGVLKVDLDIGFFGFSLFKVKGPFLKAVLGT